MAEQDNNSLMRLSLRLVAPLVLSVAVVSLIFAAYQVRTQDRTMRRDLQRRAEVLGQSLQDDFEREISAKTPAALHRTIERLGHRDHILGIAVFDPQGNPLGSSAGLDFAILNRAEKFAGSCTSDAGCHEFVDAGQVAEIHIFALPIKAEDTLIGSMALVSDASFIQESTRRMWRDTLVHAALQTLFITLLALVMTRWVFRETIARVAGWMRSLRLGKTSAAPPDRSGILAPLTHEATQMAQSLDAARAAADEEARLREAGESMWTAERLRVSVLGKLQNAAAFCGLESRAVPACTGSGWVDSHDRACQRTGDGDRADGARLRRHLDRARRR